MCLIPFIFKDSRPPLSDHELLLEDTPPVLGILESLLTQATYSQHVVYTCPGVKILDLKSFLFIFLIFVPGLLYLSSKLFDVQHVSLSLQSVDLSTSEEE